MPNAELLTQFRTCLRYRQAKSWQKPLLDPRRFMTNQLRKRGVPSSPAGTLYTVATFHLPQFTVVEGELVSQEIASYSVFEPELTEAILYLVKPGQVILDIGMHLGYYSTLFAVLVGAQGAVHAFEPTPSTRELAKRNTGRFAQIEVHPLAVWSSRGTVVLQDYGLRWMGWNSLLKSKTDQTPVTPKEIQVQSVTLDEFRASLPASKPVSLIKIDAEAAERDIIAGGKTLLAQDRPLISVEVGDQGGAGQSRLLAKDLMGLGYAPWEFRSGQFVPHQVRETYDYGNLIFAPDEVHLNEVGMMA